MQAFNTTLVSTTSGLTNTSITQTTNSTEVIEKQIEEWRKKLDKFICPISQQIMINPVIIETGQTYERKSIEEWFKLKNTCPSTGLQVKSKTLTNNYVLKTTIQEKIIKFIKKVIDNVKIWLDNENLITICHEVTNESLELIKNNNDCKEFRNELINLQCDLFVQQLTNKAAKKLEKNYIFQFGYTEEDEILNKYLNKIKDLNDINLQIFQIQKIENKIPNSYSKSTYYAEYLRLLIKLPNCNDNLLKEIFAQYNKLNSFTFMLNEEVLSKVQYKNNYFDYLVILNTNERYYKNSLLEKLMGIKYNEKLKLKFISFFKNLFKKVNLQKDINLIKVLNYIDEFNELNDEKIIIYKQLYSNTNDIKYLEKIYNLNENDKQIENQLLNEYLKLNSLDNQNAELKNIVNTLQNTLQQQHSKINYLEQDLNNTKKENQELRNNYEELQLSVSNNETDFTTKINDLHEIVNEYQILRNLTIKYPEYSNEFVKTIQIIAPLNVKKGIRYKSGNFKVFDLQWYLNIYPKGDDESKENECAIYLHLHSTKISKKKHISSIKIKYLISNSNFNDTSILNTENEFNDTETGYGSGSFKQKDYFPTITNDKQIFDILITMQKLNLKIK
ncbi:hypothetical protein ABK040_013412 [Willaertia magna]